MQIGYTIRKSNMDQFVIRSNPVSALFPATTMKIAQAMKYTTPHITIFDTVFELFLLNRYSYTFLNFDMSPVRTTAANKPIIPSSKNPSEAAVFMYINRIDTPAVIRKTNRFPALLHSPRTL